MSIHGGKEQDERNEAITLFKVCLDMRVFLRVISDGIFSDGIFSDAFERTGERLDSDRLIDVGTKRVCGCWEPKKVLLFARNFLGASVVERIL